MKRAIVMILVLALSIVTGCTVTKEKTVVRLYQGENDLWSAKFQQFATEKQTKDKTGTEYESETRNKLVVTYKNDISDFSYATYYEVSFDTDTFGHSNATYAAPYENPMVINSTGGGSATYNEVSYTNNSRVLDEESVITVTITIDDDVQTFDLTYVGY